MRSANYVEETSTSIAGTNGNGVITLTALVKTPRFSTAFGSNNTTIRYVIEDTANKKFETGIGVVGGNTLTRTKPQITWDGTTYDDSNPTPLQFGTTPPANTIKIRLSATAESQGVLMPGRLLSSSGVTGQDASWGDYPISNHLTPWNTGGTNIGVPTYNISYSYYQLSHAGLLTGFQLDVTSAATARVLSTGIYSIGSNGLPDQLITQFSSIDPATTGVKASTDTANWSSAGPVWLSPGWYAIAFSINNTGVTLRGHLNAAANAFGPTPLGRSAAYAGNKGSLLTTEQPNVYVLPQKPLLTGASISSGSQVWVGLRVES